MVQPTVHLRPALAAALAFAFGACGLMYQQIFVYALYDFSGEFVMSQSLGLGAFLLGMGLGAGGTRAASARKVVLIELALALLGGLSVFLVYGGEILLRYFYPFLPAGRAAFFFLPVAGALGFLTGQEIPLLLRLSPQAGAARILGWTYFGGLFALVTLPLVLLPALDLPRTAFLTALLSFSLGAALIWHFGLPWWMKAAALTLGLAAVPWMKFEPYWRDLHLKFIYAPSAFSTAGQIEKDLQRYAQMEPPRRRRSRYQWIDLLPAGIFKTGGEENDLSLYLDRKFQLNALTQRRYHEALAEGGIFLLGRAPKKVLVLGGGDGLLLPYLLKHPEIESIDLVELDGAMLDLARRDLELKEMNGGALGDPRVHVHRGDAFAFVRGARERYGMILVDFPLPTNYDLSLLYTREFYAFARARLVPDGLLLMDFARPGRDLRGLAVLLATLKSAGFARPFGYGEEDLFLAMAGDGRELKFAFSSIEKSLSDQVLMSLVSQEEALRRAESPVQRANSLFYPYRFVFDYSEDPAAGPRRLPYDENPGLLDIFLGRFAEYHRANFSDLKFPPAFARRLAQAFAEPRDLSPRIAPGWNWPRFQWEYRFERGKHVSVFYWFDFENPQELRAAWRPLHAPGGDWAGISYDGKNFVTYRRIEGLNRLGFESWGLLSSDGETVYFSKLGHFCQIMKGEKLLYTRRFDPRRLNVVPGSGASALAAKIFREFMIAPSSGTLDADVQLRSLFYP